MAQEHATDLGVSELDRELLDDSRALIEVKILFGLHRDITAEKTSKISIFCRIFSRKQNTRRKNVRYKKWSPQRVASMVKFSDFSHL